MLIPCFTVLHKTPSISSKLIGFHHIIIAPLLHAIGSCKTFRGCFHPIRTRIYTRTNPISPSINHFIRREITKGIHLYTVSTSQPCAIVSRTSIESRGQRRNIRVTAGYSLYRRIDCHLDSVRGNI